MRTIHVYRAAHNYFVDGIYWGDDAEGVQFYLQVTGVPPEEITKALEQVEQEGTYTVETGGGSHAHAIRVSAGGHEASAPVRSNYSNPFLLHGLWLHEFLLALGFCSPLDTQGG